MARLRWTGNLAALAGDCRGGEVHEPQTLTASLPPLLGHPYPMSLAILTAVARLRSA